MLPIIRRLEIHAAHSCNLHCEQCSHFSDHNITKPISIEEIQHSFETWNKKIHPLNFGLIGGEPFMNKSILEIIELTGRSWKNSKIDITTNGLLLYKFPDLPKLLQRYNILLQISSHHSIESTDVYDNKFNENVDLAISWVEKYGIELNIVGNVNYPFVQFKNVNGKVEHRQSEPFPWYKQYDGFGKTLKCLPTEWDPVGNYEACGAKTCPQIHDNHLYKCPPLSNVLLLKEKYGELDKSIDWAFDYTPLSPNATREEVQHFIDVGAENVCGKCPSKQTYTFIPKHDPMKLRKE
jgi:hypothetical protein